MRTARLSKALPPGMSPRLLDADAAAAYLSMSPGYFHAHVKVAGFEPPTRGFSISALGNDINDPMGLDCLNGAYVPIA